MPGLMGSKLARAEQRTPVYPGTLFDYYRRQLNDNDFATLSSSDTELIPSDIIRETHGVNVYKSLIEHFKSIGYKEFKTNKIFESNSRKVEKKYRKQLYVLPYDWRLPIQKHVRMLSDLVRKIAIAEKLNRPKLNIILVGHSLGGLIQRAYLESRRIAGINDGYKVFVRLYIGIAVPHYGSFKSYKGIIGDAKSPFLSREQIAVLANKNEFPIMYQLLPSDDTKLDMSKLPNTKSIQEFKAIRKYLVEDGQPKTTKYYFIGTTAKPTIVGSTNKSAPPEQESLPSDSEDEYSDDIMMPDDVIETDDGIVGKLHNVPYNVAASMLFGDKCHKETIEDNSVFKYDGDGCVRVVPFNKFSNAESCNVETKKSHKFIFKSKKVLRAITSAIESIQ